MLRGFSREECQRFRFRLVQLMRECFELCLGKELLELLRLLQCVKVLANNCGSDVEGKSEFAFAIARTSPINQCNVHQCFVVLGSFEEC